MTGSEGYDALLERQLTMTQATWLRLVRHGVRENTELRLDFAYDAASYHEAKELQRFLTDETDYESGVTANQDRWRITGTTQPTTVSLAILEQWVEWMVATGLEFGCVFDGWGSEMPSAPRG
jgi:hypothetical protein